jgi:hypothetical protein
MLVHRPVRQWLELQVFLDSVALYRGKLTFKMKLNLKWGLFCSSMTWRKQGEIAPRDMDRGLTAATSPWILPPDISDSICHWAHLMDDWSTQRALWITAGHVDQVDACAHGAYDLVSSTRPAILIDVGNTRTVLWPFLHGIGTALPQFREELAKIARGGIEILESHYISDRRSGGTTMNRLSYNNGSEPWFMRRLKTFLRDPLT